MADEDAPAAPPPASYETLLAATPLAPNSIAAHWATTAGLDAQLTKPIRNIANLTADSDFTAVVALTAASAQPSTHLIVRNNRFHILHSLRRCPVTGNGTRCLGLIGDRTTRSGRDDNPSLFRATGNANNQASAFNTVTVHAPELDAVLTAFAADDAPALLPNANTNPAITSIKAIPLHRSWAALFLPGPSISAGIRLGHALIQLLPEATRPDVEPFARFLRAAAITNDAETPASVLTGPWVSVSTSDDEDLADWYYEVLEQVLPPPTAPTPTTAPTLAQDPTVNATVQALTAQIGRDPPTTDYTPPELTKLFRSCGLPTDAGLTTTDLPIFFQELRNHRTKKSLRTFLEGFHENHYPLHTTRYTFVMSPQFLTDIKTLTFHGGDPLSLWSERMKGWTLFALAPAGEGEHLTDLRAKMLYYEDTEHQHRPADRKEMAHLARHASVPATRYHVARWLDHYIKMTRVFFGPAMPLLPHLEAIHIALESTYFTLDFDASDFQKTIWATHRATRSFFFHHNDQPLQRVNADIRAFHCPVSTRLPRELALPSSPTSVIPGVPYPQGLPAPAAPAPSPPPAKKPRLANGATFAPMFRPPIDRANQLATAKNLPFRARLLFKDSGAIQTLFGPEFLALLQGSRTPCLRYFIFGDCSTHRPCPHSHVLSHTPPKPVLDGIFTRLCQSVDHFERHPNA